MKYLMNQDKKGNVILTRTDNANKLFKGSHKMKKEEFLGQARKRVEGLKEISQFVYIDETLYVTWIKYSRYGDLIQQAEIVLADSLVKDGDFVGELEDISGDFALNRDEARENFKELYHHLMKRREERAECKDMLVKYAKTGELEEMSPEKVATMISILKGNRTALLACGHIPYRSKVARVLENVLAGGTLGTIAVALVATMGSIATGTDIFTLISVCGWCGLYVFAHAGDALYNKFQNDMCDTVLLRLELNQDSLDTQEDVDQIGEVEPKEHDLFFDLVKDVIRYIKNHPEEDYSRATASLRQLAEDYREATSVEKESGYPYRRKELLDDLARIEYDVYGRENRVGLKDTLDVAGFSSNVLARLSYLGYDVQEVSKDEFLSSLMNTINTLADTPFYGCEMEILRLARIAVSYAQGVLTYGSKEEFGKTQDYTHLLNRSISAQSAAIHRLESVKQHAELAASRKGLEAVVSTVSIGDTQSKITSETPKL